MKFTKKTADQLGVVKLPSSNNVVMFNCIRLTIAVVSVTTVIYSYVRHERLKEQLSSLQNQLTREEMIASSLYRDLNSDVDTTREHQKTAQENSCKALNAKVCSDANRYNNKAQKAIKSYNITFRKLQEELPAYKKRYDKCSTLEKKIRQIQKELNLDEESFSEVTINNYSKLELKVNLISKKDTMVKLKVQKAQKYADALYDEYYRLMLLIVTGECGDTYYPSTDQYYVMNVIENRVKSKYYPDTVREVIFQPGQYQPTWDGSWSKTPNNRTKKNVKKYLRGKIETDMPENVVYQAMFTQGDYVWRHVSNPVDSGHWYCVQATK